LFLSPTTTNKSSDAESVEQMSRRLLLTFSERLNYQTDIGLHSHSLISPYAILFVAFGDKRNNNSASDKSISNFSIAISSEFKLQFVLRPSRFAGGHTLKRKL